MFLKLHKIVDWQWFWSERKYLDHSLSYILLSFSVPFLRLPSFPLHGLDFSESPSPLWNFKFMLISYTSLILIVFGSYLRPATTRNLQSLLEGSTPVYEDFLEQHIADEYELTMQPLFPPPSTPNPCTHG